jgi:hypothetical protein
MSSGNRTDPLLWEIVKEEAKKKLGGHSARAIQLAGRLYKERGGGYIGPKTAEQKSLSKWTKQEWTTKSGKPSSETGERYLPKKAIAALTTAEYDLTSKLKRAGMAKGVKYVKQPKNIIEKVRKFVK